MFIVLRKNRAEKISYHSYHVFEMNNGLRFHPQRETNPFFLCHNCIDIDFPEDYKLLRSVGYKFLLFPEGNMTSKVDLSYYSMKVSLINMGKNCKAKSLEKYNKYGDYAL